MSVRFGHQHLALADMVRGRDHALILHLLHQPRGLVVADAQLPLDVGGRALAILDHDRHRLIVQRVLAVGIAAGIQPQHRVDIAFLAAKAGATFISPFIGRLDDINLDGLELIGDIRLIYDNYGYDTQILAASIRTVNHVTQSALIGADVMTAPPSVIKSLASHPLTDKGLAAFLSDIEQAGQKIF